MNNSLKGALLSGLVFPGLGQIALKQYKRGIALIFIVLVSLSVIVAKAVQQAFSILEMVGTEGGAIDMKTISSAATQATYSSDGMIINFALFLVLLCWIIGVVDAYRIGKKKDLEQQSTERV